MMMLNYAYETMFQAFALTKEQDRVIHALRVVSQKTGIHGMLGGQSVDVENDGKPLEKEMLDYIYRNKTSALIEASMMTGAILAGANEQEVSAVEKAAGNIGLALLGRPEVNRRSWKRWHQKSALHSRYRMIFWM